MTLTVGSESLCFNMNFRSSPNTAVSGVESRRVYFFFVFERVPEILPDELQAMPRQQSFLQKLLAQKFFINWSLKKAKKTTHG